MIKVTQCFLAMVWISFSAVNLRADGNCRDPCKVGEEQDGQIFGSVQGVSARGRVNVVWTLINALPVNPTGGSFTFAHTSTLGTFLPIWRGDCVPGFCTAADISQLNEVAYAECNGTRSFLGNCAGTNFLPPNSYGKAEALTQVNQGYVRTDSHSLYGLGQTTFNLENPQCFAFDFETAAEVGVAVAKNFYDAESIVGNGVDPTIIRVCVDAELENAEFGCSFPSGPISGGTAKPSAHQLRVSVTTGAQASTFNSVQIKGPPAPIGTGVFALPTPFPCEDSQLIIPIFSSLPLKIRIELIRLTLGDGGDFNLDGLVNRSDMPLFRELFGSTLTDETYDIRADMDLDGDVDFDDVGLFYAKTPDSLRCNPADIAYDGNESLPPVGAFATNLNPLVNNGVTESDYNLFLSDYFNGNVTCDIANDDVTPLPPFGSLTTNNGVTEADFTLFFSLYFDGCAF